jgi:lipopolysaccharide transport system ATP-binding protein
MQAVNFLCQKAVWLQNGGVKQIGGVREVVNTFMSSLQQSQLQQTWDNPDQAPGNEYVRISSVEVIPQLAEDTGPIDVRTPLRVRFSVWNMVDAIRLSTSLELYTNTGECVFTAPSPMLLCDKGLLEGECLIPGNLLNDGLYFLSLSFIKDASTVLFQHQECLSFRVEDHRENAQWFGKWPGIVRPILPFTWRVAVAEKVL